MLHIFFVGAFILLYFRKRNPAAFGEYSTIGFYGSEHIDENFAGQVTN